MSVARHLLEAIDCSIPADDRPRPVLVPPPRDEEPDEPSAGLPPARKRSRPRKTDRVRIDWSKVDLGKRIDREIARELGVPRTSVTTARHARGIRSALPHGGRHD